MIVDTHTPSYRGQVPEEKVMMSAVWRPVDKSLVFGIAWRRDALLGLD